MGRSSRSPAQTDECLRSFGSRGAEEDLLWIFSDLEEYAPKRGEAFVESLDFTLAHVRRYPEMAPLFDPPMRRLVIGSTGFGLFYSVEARGIIIHSLMHLSRNPERIREKIRRLLGLR